MRTGHKTMIVGLMLLVGLSWGFSIGLAADFAPQKGVLHNKAFDSVKFYVYTTPIPMGASASVVIETPNGLILQDVQQNKPFNEELQALIVSLGKPLQRIYISHEHAHHWAGLEMFPGVPVYANQATIDGIREKGEGMLKEIKERFGEEAVPYTKVVVPEHAVALGEESIDGVRFVFSAPAPALTGPVLFMEFPDQKVMIAHHLAYVGVHVPMPPVEARLAKLNEMKATDYAWVIGGHGIPSAGPDFFAQTTDYFTTLGKVTAESKDVAEAKEKMIKAYPNYGGVFLLDAILPAFYKK